MAILPWRADMDPSLCFLLNQQPWFHSPHEQHKVLGISLLASNSPPTPAHSLSLTLGNSLRSTLCQLYKLASLKSDHKQPMSQNDASNLALSKHPPQGCKHGSDNLEIWCYPSLFKIFVPIVWNIRALWFGPVYQSRHTWSSSPPTLFQMFTTPPQNTFCCF